MNTKNQYNSTSQIWLGGIHTLEMLLEHSPERILHFVITEQRHDTKAEALIKKARQEKISVQPINKNKLDELLPGVNHQGVAALCRSMDILGEHDLADLLTKNNCNRLLVLDGLQDPHNLGACLRSADAAGVDAIIIPKDRSVQLTATVRKIACGAAELVPVIAVTNISRTLGEIKEAGFWTVGLAGEAEKSIYETDLRGKIALVMGAEESGLRRLTRDHCDFLAKIPMVGHVESLNVSVATGISLFEMVRQNLK